MSNAGDEPIDTSQSGPTEGDWREIKKDVKEIVRLLRSLAPQPDADQRSATDTRILDCEPEEWLSMLRPTSARLDVFAGVLLVMFIKNEDEIPMLRGIWDRDLGQIYLPTFANKLTLRIPRPEGQGFQEGFPEVTPGDKSAEEKMYIRRYIKQQRAATTTEVNDNSTRWTWAQPDNGDFLFNYIENTGGHKLGVFRHLFPEHSEIIVDNARQSASTHGHGSLCVMCALVQNGVLHLRWVNLIIALISRWNYTERPNSNTYNEMHFGSVMYFLGVFAGFWPSPNERSTFSCVHDYRKVLEGNFRRHYLQVHFRYFIGVQPPMERQDAFGLKCDRSRFEIVSDKKEVASSFFEERRISVFGLVSGNPSGDLGKAIPAFYDVLILGEEKPYHPKSYNLKCCVGLEGAVAFQVAVFEIVNVWETEWNSVLTRIDDFLQSQIGDTLLPKAINKLMFDNNFQRPRLYFAILQALRLFAEHICTVSDDLHALDNIFLERSDFPMPDMKHDELHVLRSNWEIVKATQKKAEKSLLDRISSKTEVVRNLRDGLLRASTLREANRSSVMGRYVLIFTVVTVLYLPPSFISSVLNMEIFQKENKEEATWEFKVSLVLVSLTTYIAALAAIIAVDWKHIKPKCLRWWARLKTKWWKDHKKRELASDGNTAGDSTTSAAHAGAHAGAGPTPLVAEPRSREAGSVAENFDPTLVLIQEPPAKNEDQPLGRDIVAPRPGGKVALNNSLNAYCAGFNTTGSLLIQNACTTYLVKAGDTYSTIAKANNVTSSRIISENPILDLTCGNIGVSLNDPTCIGKPGVPYASPTVTIPVKGDYRNLVCLRFNINLNNFLFLNPAVNVNCTNLFALESYCVVPVSDLITYPGYPGYVAPKNATTTSTWSSAPKATYTPPVLNITDDTPVMRFGPRVNKGSVAA
ncbi:hypothetical protein NUW58_g2616 [Xylaria curta]|uniref:Uncharacterized protein n=1 Tax=Xylaria curta TaxID=42375 RepID=A0ACC1PGB2_9PEZI|nr:hypothetical protein NUW58_g2616 [Xylaria curta]